MTKVYKIPLFPIGVVMLPDMLLPLHIFEERYKQMITECMQADKPFGIVLFDGQSMHAVGCMARITRVIKRYDDGRMDILTRGERRFVVQQWIEEQAYMEGQVLFFDDEQEKAPADKLSGRIASALKLLEEVLGEEARELFPDDSGSIDPKQLAFAIAALEGFTPAERQGVLQMTSLSERLDKCVQALSRILTRNRLTSEILKVIGGNGSPPKSILWELKTQSKDGDP
jgi:Lon protease-like protein